MARWHVGTFAGEICLFLILVDSRFTEQVDTLLDSLTPLLKDRAILA